MEYVIGAVWNGLELLFVILFSGSFLPKKSIKKQHIILIVILWMITCVYSNIPINQFLKQLLTATVYTVLSMILYQGTCMVHICLGVISYLFVAAMDAFTIHGMCYLLGINYDTFAWRKFFYVTLVTADKLLTVFAAWILHHSQKRETWGNSGASGCCYRFCSPQSAQQ